MSLEKPDAQMIGSAKARVVATPSMSPDALFFTTLPGSGAFMPYLVAESSLSLMSRYGGNVVF